MNECFGFVWGEIVELLFWVGCLCGYLDFFWGLLVWWLLW